MNTRSQVGPSDQLQAEVGEGKPSPTGNAKPIPDPADNWYHLSIQLDQYTVDENHFIKFEDVSDSIYHALQHGVISATVRRV